MSKRVRILCVEDVYTDAQLIKMELEKAKMTFEFVVVDNRESYVQALDQYVPDIVLCDHSLPSFNSIEALSILRQRPRIVPFIIITGSMTDEVALELIKNGAEDYIIKDRLRRLPFSVMNALEKHEHEQEKNVLLWKVRQFEEKTMKDLSDLSSKLTLATRAAKLTVWEYYFKDDVIVNDSSVNEVIGYDILPSARSLKDWLSLTHPDDVKIIYEAMATGRNTCGDFTLEFRMLLPNRELIHVWVKGIVEPGADGKPYRIIGTTQNVTAEKLKDINVRDSEIRYKSIWDNTIDAIIVGTPDGRVLAANPAACALLARSEAEICSVGRNGILQQDNHLEQQFRERSKLGSVSGELTFVKGDGKTFIGELSSNVFQDASGRKRTITIVRDVTARKKLELEIVAQANRYADLFEVAPSAVGYMSGPEHLFEMANELYVTLSGGRRLLGKTVREAFPELDEHPIHSILEQVYTHGQSFRSHETLFTIQMPETSSTVDIYLDYVYMPHRNDAGEVCGVFFFANDITEQVNLRNKIAERERNYKNLFELSPLAKLVVTQDDYSIIRGNAMAASVYGHTADELSAMNFTRLLPPDTLQQQMELFEQVKSTKQNASMVVERVSQSGIKSLLEVSVTDFTYKGKEAFLIVANDVTERFNLQNALTEIKVSAQKRITRAEVRGQEKEKELIGKELHDNVNQQLCTVQLLLNIAKGDPKSYAEVLPKCETVIQSAISDIRALCKSLVLPSIKDVGLRASILELVDFYRESNKYTIKEKIDAIIDTLDSDLQVAIYRILQELFTNITKYASPQTVKVEMSVREGQFILSVEDDGLGFDLKEKRKGIGLANMRNRVDLFGGKFHLRSAPGAGCRTKISIPVSQPDTKGLAKDKVSILVAEDDELDQELIKTTIASLNQLCEVTFVANGKQLIEHVLTVPDEQLPALIVLDYNMPLLNGLETLRQLKDIHRVRDTPKVVYSTSNLKLHRDECRKAEASAYIKKGSTLEEMQEDIKKMFKHLRDRREN